MLIFTLGYLLGCATTAAVVLLVNHLAKKSTPSTPA